MLSSEVMSGTPHFERGGRIPPGEGRVALHNVSWSQYQALLAIRGEVAVPRVAGHLTAKDIGLLKKLIAELEDE